MTKTSYGRLEKLPWEVFYALSYEPNRFFRIENNLICYLLQRKYAPQKVLSFGVPFPCYAAISGASSAVTLAPNA